MMNENWVIYIIYMMIIIDIEWVHEFLFFEVAVLTKCFISIVGYIYARPIQYRRIFMQY